MPIFEYACPNCKHIFEELAASSDQTPRPCPECAFPNAEKILSATRKGGCGKFSSDAFSRAKHSSQGCTPRGSFS